MPRFVIQTDGASERMELDLPTVAEAKCEAARYAGSLLCDRAGDYWDGRDFSIRVSDESGLTLFTLQIVGIDAPAIQHPRLGTPPIEPPAQ